MRKTYIPKTYKKQSRSKSRNFIIGFLKFLIFIIIVGGIGYLLYSPILNIVKFEVSLEDGTLRDNIMSRTQDLVEDKTYWWYNNKNIFLLRGNGLENDLLQEFPQIKSMLIKRNLLDKTVNLDITLRKSAFYNCYDSSCYLISEDGFNMGISAGSNEDLVEIKGISQKSAGKPVLTEREINWLINIVEEYNKIDSLKITYIDIQQKSGDNIVSIFVYTDKGYYIMLDLDTDVIYQAQVLKQVFISQIPLERQDELEYIDLRIKDRAYYKLK
jgi:hypothetical protein